MTKKKLPLDITEPATQLPTGREGRFYRTHSGIHLPSVTTILGVINKPALVPWAARVEKEAALAAFSKIVDENLELDMPMPSGDMLKQQVIAQMGKAKAHTAALAAAANIGTEVHNLIDWHFRKEVGKPCSDTAPTLTSDEALRSFERFEEWRLNTKLKVIDTERKIVSLLGRYAGTLDTLIEIDGKRYVIDFKTGKRVYAEAFLQNCAYRLALGEQGIRTHGGFIILLPKQSDDEDFKVVEVPPLSELISAWQGAYAIWEWQYNLRNKK